jgi:hypothetical protein
MSDADEQKENAAVNPGTGSWLLDTILKPGSSVSAPTLAFLDKVFYILFASILFLM